MTRIRIDQLTKRFGNALAVDRVSIEINPGELFFLLGPSGCGKTTLLRMLAGFVQPDSGDIYFGEERITHVPPRRRGTGMVFQTYALWPHMSVAANVAYGLEVRGLSRAEIAKKVSSVLERVRLPGMNDRRPNQLSGGQQQRVALARALVIEPRVLLLDEPLSNLDARLRDELREEIRRLHAETGLTMVYVTHDQKEALTLADRLALMEKGRLVQVGSPQEVYRCPKNQFVASFLGDSNFVRGAISRVAGDECDVETPLGKLTGKATVAGVVVGSKVCCSIRPQSWQVDAKDCVSNCVTVKVEHTTFLGDVVQMTVRGPNGTQLQVLSFPSAVASYRQGDTMKLAAPSDEVVVLCESS